MTQTLFVFILIFRKTGFSLFCLSLGGIISPMVEKSKCLSVDMTVLREHSSRRHQVLLR